MKIELTDEQLNNLKYLLNKVIFQGGYDQVKSEITALEDIANTIKEQDGKKETPKS